jgi:tetratricopeptide repeat protein 21B
MRDLKAVSQVADVELAASAAMVTCHEQAKVQDTEAIMTLQDKIDVEEGSASDSSCLLLASYLMYTPSKERARGLAGTSRLASMY